MSERQIIPPSEIIPDGKIHRCDAEGKNGRGDAAYLLHLDGAAAGGFENHRDGRGWENWRADTGRKLSLAEEAAIRARVNDQRKQREMEDAARLVETKARAQAVWEASTRTAGEHPYLTAKSVEAHKCRLFPEELTIGGMTCAGSLVVPMRNASGEICQLQLIAPSGEKRYLPGPKPPGLYFSIGKPTGTVCIAEGFATAASIHQATGHAVAVAFDCGNLEAVAKVMRGKLPNAMIILCADDALAFASTKSCGGRWPDGTRATVGHVLVWSSEDDAKDTLVPRLIAMGADLGNVHFIQTASDGERTRAFDPATDIPQLRSAIQQLKIHPDLLIVDPIVSAVAGDSHKGSETRRSLQPLVDLGIAEGCAVLGISHFSKGTAGRDVIERVTGSIAFGALARLVFAAAKMPDDQGGGRFIARAKSNIGVDGGGFKYELQQHTLADHPGVSASTLLWGEAIQGNARDILAQAEVTEDPETRSQTSEAEDWLRDLLMDGQVKATDATKKAKSAGISDKSLRAARERLGVKPRKTAYSGGWIWSLPHAQDAQTSQGVQGARTQSEGILGIFDGQGHLGRPNGKPDAEVF